MTTTASKHLKHSPSTSTPTRISTPGRPTGEVMAFSQPRSLASKDPKTLQIEATRHIWEPTRHPVHAAMERFPGQSRPRVAAGHGPYDEWIKPLIEHPIWEFSEDAGVRIRLCDLRRSIGGSFDLLVGTPSPNPLGLN